MSNSNSIQTHNSSYDAKLLKFYYCTLFKMKKTFIVLTAILTLWLILGILEDTAGVSVVAQMNKPNTLDSTKANITGNMTKANSTSDTFSESGKINSLIYLSSDHNNSSFGAAKKFILFGDWNLIVNRGIISSFKAKFINVLPDGERWHSHELANFKAYNNTKVLLTGEGTLSMSGVLDVKLNDTDAWEGVKTNIVISKGVIITIFLDNLATGDHFRGQPIYGTVESIKDSNGNTMKKVIEKQLRP